MKLSAVFKARTTFDRHFVYLPACRSKTHCKKILRSRNDENDLKVFMRENSISYFIETGNGSWLDREVEFFFGNEEALAKFVMRYT